VDAVVQVAALGHADVAVADVAALDANSMGLACDLWGVGVRKLGRRDVLHSFATAEILNGQRILFRPKDFGKLCSQVEDAMATGHPHQNDVAIAT